ncbi:MAG: NAD(P)-dependent oxidoreductase [Bacteroidetes bacterium]|nr:NAD(P)-dependent oxidoreductase [Bacteroidota bacterium]
MNITEVINSRQLREFMSTPTDGVINCVRNVKGDILILGGSGKMGPELTEMIARADAIAGIKRTVSVASTFSNPRERTAELFTELGVRVLKGELTDADFLARLPDAENVIYMPGFKFGSSDNWDKAVQVNCILPYLVGEKYRESRIVVFSSANPYAFTTVESGGSKEGDALDPKGIYGWSIVARESSFTITARKYPAQRSCYYRLTYAQHLAYGVIVDLAKSILEGKEISLAVPHVNMLSQRDANDRAIRALEICSNPPSILNVSGPIYAVRDIASRLGEMLGKKPVLVGEEPDRCLLVNDTFCVQRFGPYQDSLEDIMTAVVSWVKNGGDYWGKPTKFGEAKRVY